MSPEDLGGMFRNLHENRASNTHRAYGPHSVDAYMRYALSYCWLLLPPERRNAQTIKAELQRILDRAVANFQEDATAFGFDPPPSK